MNRKMFLLLIAVLAIGIVVLPETMSMFAGQHNMYDTIATGNQVPCEKCHSDVSSELTQPGSVNAVHNAQGCKGCHITTAPGKENLTQGTDFHAAALPLCIDCHDGSVGNNAGGINSNDEAHKNFFDASNGSTLLKGANEACIACHSHVRVNITWVKYNTMALNVDETLTITNISGSGTTTLTTGG